MYTTDAAKEFIMEHTYRIEHDSVGSLSVPANAYYGIHTLRAQENFPITGHRMLFLFVQQIALVKKAAALVNKNGGFLAPEKADAIIWACDQILAGEHQEDFFIDAMQGGAGTSANMNVNEVVANLAIEHLGGTLGDYSIIHPNDHVNMAQSTNDVIPSAAKLTTLVLARALAEELRKLKAELEEKANSFDHILKMGRTQMQDAVPMRLGQSFAAFAAAIGRDIHRLEDSLDAMRVLNMGATAIGSGINVPPFYFNNICPALSELVGEELTQAKDLFDATQNIDCFVEVSGALKACAVNLSKMANDLRLLSSGPRTGFGEIHLPPRQNGSSIMPGKINPVIPEIVNQAAFLVIGHDVTITIAAQAGQLELNAFGPVIFYQLFEAFLTLAGAVDSLTRFCIHDLTANEERCHELVDASIGIVTALVPHIGYKEASRIAHEALDTGIHVKDIVLREGLMDEETLNHILNPYRLTEPSRE